MTSGASSRSATEDAPDVMGALLDDHDVGRVFEVGHRLEEGRDVQCDVLGSRLREPAPTTQEKNREDVVCSLCHADDVRSQGVRPKARAALGDRLEYVQRARGLVVRRSRWLLSLL